MVGQLNTEHRHKIKVLTISYFRIIRESLKVLIEEAQDMSVESCDISNVLPTATFIKGFDAVLIYLIDEDTETVEIISKLLEIGSHLRIIVVAAEKDSANQMRAVELGAVGVVNRGQSPRSLLEAIRQICRGETWINQRLLTKLLNNKNHDHKDSKNRHLAPIDYLTNREKEVVQMIGKGLKNKDIAKRLFIREATVRHHLSSIYGKLYVEDRLNLVIYAYRHNLIQIESAEQDLNIV